LFYSTWEAQAMSYRKEQAREGIAALVHTSRANRAIFLKTRQEAQARE
jgi:hypothetical protein